MNSIFNRGAQNGLYVGIYMVILAWVIVMATSSGVMNLLALLMLALIPVICFYMLRRSLIADEGKSLLSGLWLEGIVTFMCGSLILSLAVYIYLRWINPDFVAMQIADAIKVYEDIEGDQAEEVVTLLKQIEKNRAYPTPQQIVVQLSLFITFFGSVLSLIIATILKLRKK